MNTEKFADIFKKQLSDGGVFLNFESWGGKNCSNANDLPVGIRTKAGAQSTTGYPTDAMYEWGILITAKIGYDFTQIFVIHHGPTVYIRGGAIENVTTREWYKYSPATTKIPPVA